MSRTSSLMQAAVVLNSLPKQQAAQLLSRLEPGDIKTVLDAVTRLDDVSADEISKAMTRLTSATLRMRSEEDPSCDPAVFEAQRHLDAALATPRTKLEKAVESASPFAFMLETIPMIRSHLLADEHPKNIAIVLSTLPPEIASQTMKGLDPALQFSVLKRLCEIEELNEEEVAELSFALKLRFRKLLNSRQAKSAGLDKAADLLSCSDSDIRESLLTYVGQTDPDLAAKLQRSVFGIERLESLNSGEIKTILKNVDTSCWAPALKNAPSSLISKILGNLASGPAKILNYEIEEIGHIDANVEDLARQNIIQVVLELARNGKIEMRKNGPREPQPLFPKVGQTDLWDTTSFIN